MTSLEDHTITDPTDPGFNACYVVGQDSGQDFLQQVNTSDASANLIGATGSGNQIKDMAFQPGTGTLFAVEGGSSGGTQLGTIDTSTGQFTALPQSFGTGTAPSDGPVSFTQIEGLSFDPTDGTLYAVHQRSNNRDLLFQVDPTTGKYADDAFGLGVDYIKIDHVLSGNDNIDAIAIDPIDGQLYGIAKAPGQSDTLVTINKTTGASATVGPMGPNNLEGISFDLDGNLWATTVSAGGAGGGSGGNQGNSLYSIDKTDGSTDRIGTIPNLSKYEALACGLGGPTQEPSAELVLNKTADKEAVVQGESVEFTITLTNEGPDNTTGVVVEDVLGPGLTFEFASTVDGVYSNGVWTIGDLDVGQTATLTLTAEATGDPGIGDTGNLAEVTNSDVEPHPDSVLFDSTTLSITGPNEADLSLAKTVDVDTPAPGEQFNYTIAVSNAGPEDATNVTVEDGLPTGVTVVGDDPSQGTYANGEWEVGTIPAEGSATLVLTVEATGEPGQVVTNTATITDSDPDDPTDDDREDTVTVTITAADLAVEKTVDDDTPAFGQQVTFDVSVTNNGPSNATGVVLEDALPAGLTFVSASGDGIYANASGFWTVGDLPVGETATLQITATFDTDQAVTNVASVNESDQFDQDSGNDEAEVTLTPEDSADLAVTKTVDNPVPNVGDQITYTVEVENLGPSDASSIVVTDQLPAGVEFVSADPDGVYDNETGEWTVGTLAQGEFATLTITATVTESGTIVNTATITDTDTVDPNPDNDQDSASIGSEALADLELTKDVDRTTIDSGDSVTFTIELTNNGPSAANVTVTESLPADYTITGSSAGQGSFDESSQVWDVGQLAAGASTTLQITAQATLPAGGDLVNIAQVATSDVDDPDSVAGNNAPQEDDQDTVTVTVNQETVPDPEADLELAKSVNRTTASPGQTVTFAIDVSNEGPDDATSVVVEDRLPDGLTLVSTTPSQGSYDAGAGLWTVGDLDDGDSATLTLVADVTTVLVGPQTNVAQVFDADQFDPDSTPANNDPGEDDYDRATVSVELGEIEFQDGQMQGTIRDDLSRPVEATVFLRTILTPSLATDNFGITREGPDNYTIQRVDSVSGAVQETATGLTRDDLRSYEFEEFSGVTVSRPLTLLTETPFEGADTDYALPRVPTIGPEPELGTTLPETRYNVRAVSEATNVFGTSALRGTNTGQTGEANVNIRAAEPPEFEVTTIDPADATIRPAEDLTVTANITNLGDVTGTQTVRLLVDGVEQDSTELTLIGDELRTVELTASAVSLDPGEYTFTVETGDSSLEGTLTISDGTPSWAVSYVDENGVATLDGALDAIDDYEAGEITLDQVLLVIDSYDTGTPLVDLID